MQDLCVSKLACCNGLKGVCAKLKLITTALHLVPLLGGYLEIAPTPHPVIRPVLPKVHNHGSQKSKNWFRNITWVLNFFGENVWWITTQKPSVLYQFFFWNTRKWRFFNSDPFFPQKKTRNGQLFTKSKYMANTRKYWQALSNSLSAMYSWKHFQILL